MRFSEHWLREWIDPPIETAKLAERLTLLGLEVDAIETAAPPFSGVVVGLIERVDDHPEADRLRLCRVSDGSDKPRAVICGAANARAGLKVPYARDGATLPDGRMIALTEVRGLLSEGMLCSARELGMDDETAQGLLELDPEAPVGVDYRHWARLDDPIIELELTPNRGDCLSIRGLARETAAAFGLAAQGPALDPVAPTLDQRLPIWLEAPRACPRYTGRIIRGVNANVATPSWLSERLRRSGVRPIHPVVDVTNYVMLELGQPMHAFDLAQLQEGIHVRFAERHETMALLDGRDVELDPETLVIADSCGPVALAGIMGGAQSAVHGGTVDIFLESACFLPHALAGRARHYNAHSESSHRFERGVDPELAATASERATALICAVCGGEPGPIHDARDEECMPVRDRIRLRRSRLERMLGHNPGNARVSAILDALGLNVVADDTGWSVTPPPWRFDLTIEADLIEEVARVDGYNHSPRTHPVHAARIEPTPENHRDIDQLRNELVARDYCEAITYSFVDRNLQCQLDPRQDPLPLTNPISADMDVMRTGLWPGLIQALRYNQNRQQERVRLFEIGMRFPRGEDANVRQETAVAMLAAGPLTPEHWNGRRREVDFFDVKGDLEALLQPSGLHRFRFEPGQHPALHPGQTARILADDGQPAGWIGVLHPGLLRDLDLSVAPVLVEMAAAPLLEQPLPAYTPISRHPSIRRDLALIVEETLSAEHLVAAAREAAPQELQSAFVFDVYRGKGIDSGRKSFALGLILQGFGRTLTDHEVEDAVTTVLRYLQSKFGATLREQGAWR